MCYVALADLTYILRSLFLVNNPKHERCTLWEPASEAWKLRGDADIHGTDR